MGRRLDEILKGYAAGDMLPFHMPGHKRHDALAGEADLWGDIYSYDITEIDGFDDLHAPTGVIAELEQGYAAIYRADRAYLSVNGSTAAIEAAVFADTAPGDVVLAARFSHKSFYHAAALRGLAVEWIYPAHADGAHLGMQLDEDEVLGAIARCPEAKLLFLTTPDYLGFWLPLGRIVKAAHEAGMRVVIDSAHGAHVPFSAFFGEDPLLAGADHVIMSLHKTLPALTQTAVLFESGAPDHSLVREYLDWFETSSPSYLLLAGAARCLTFLSEQGEGAFYSYEKRLRAFYDRAAALRRLHIADRQDKDRSKIVVDTAGSGITGVHMARNLREDYHIETEAAGLLYVLALSSVMDDEAALDRLFAALSDADARMMRGELPRGTDEKYDKDAAFAVKAGYLSPRRVKMTASEALAAGHHTDVHRTVGLTEALGMVSAAYILPYPPGVPVIAPGEVFDEECAKALGAFMRAGVSVKGIDTDNNGNISVSVVG